jgi:tRNA A37 methylthiotransferase MiaB
VERARDLGACEIHLAAPDTSAWGEETPGGPRLPELVRAASSISGGFKLKLGAMSPRSLHPIAEEYLRGLATAKAFRFLHLPLASGSDAVLASMHQGYRVAEFRRIVRTARRHVPDILLSTEVVVGHPSESEEDFRATLALLEEVEPESVRARCFSAPPSGTSEMSSGASPRVARRRSRDAVELGARLAQERLDRWVGWEGTVVISSNGPDGTCLGRLPNYLPVRLAERLSLGALAPVRVDETEEGFLHGICTGPAEAPAPSPA